MVKRKFTIITALLLAFMMVFGTLTVYADNESDLKDVQNEIKQNEKDLEEGRKEEKALEEEIEELEVRISQSENELAKINVEIGKTEGKIEKATVELEEAEEKVSTQNTNLNSRLRAMYKNGSIGFIDVILNSGSVSELIMNLEMVKMIFASDQEVLQELQESYDIIEAKKNELENLQDDLVGQKQAQLSLQDELAEDKKTVSAKKAEVAKSNDLLEDNIAALKEEEDRIEAIIMADSNSSGSGGGSGGAEYTDGVFTWPVPGWTSISSPYGQRICPFHGPEWHTGIDIPAGYGETVVAAASGVVIAASYQGGYGNCVIISHGGSVYSLYAHNSSLTVSVGQSVSKGQQVARIGSTGSSTGNHLHFEVREGSGGYGTDVSPWKYLK